MKKSAYSIFLLPVLLFACKGKEVQCTVKKYKTPVNIIFSGYNAADLDTIFLNKYRAGSNFQTPIKSDVLLNTDIFMAHDTAFISVVKLPFTALDGDADYTLTIPSTGTRYYLSDIRYDNDTVYTYTRKRNCGTFGSIPHPPYSVAVDGTTVPAAFITGGSTWIILGK